jgi:hypothetical protein
MTTYWKVSCLIGCSLWTMGCQSIPSDRTRLSIHCEPPPKVAPIATVEVGGEVMTPKTIPVSSQYTLSLRQALLQAGGIKQQLSTGTPQVIEKLPPTTSKAFSPTSPAKGQDIELQNKIVKIFSEEKEMRRLLSVNSSIPILADRIQFRSPDQVGLAFDEFLQEVAQSVRISLERDSPRKLDTSTLDWNLDDPRVLLESLRSVFATLRDFNPEYANSAIPVFDQFLSSSSQSTELPSTRLETIQPVDEQLSVSPTGDVHQTVSAPLLIGLENLREVFPKKRTIFVHPELVFHTAIGDLPLRDGDFVYAIRAHQTSLPARFEMEYQNGNTVVGLDPAYNAIDPRDYKTIDRLLNVKNEALRKSQEPITLEDVCVVTRLHQEALGEQVFCIPINQEGRSSTKIPAGSIMPGDQFQFAYASRTSFLMERLVEPIQERIQQRAAEAQRCQEVRERLPADGSYLSRWNANVQSYARPVIQSARKLVR